jgi:UDP-4-amino-4,6-dideoxy-N-acetyl-beta-L-altrosamine N-acetyltransferase
MLKFIKLREDHLEMILRWRLKPEVTQYMLTDVVYDLDKQNQWFLKISQDERIRYWVIVYQNIPIGLINLAEIDLRHRRCSVGYYIGESEYRSIGAMVTPYLYNYVFKEIKLRKIHGEVVVGNENALKMNLLHGFNKVGIYKDHIFKNDRFHDVILIELLSEDWLQRKRYKQYIETFD